MATVCAGGGVGVFPGVGLPAGGLAVVFVGDDGGGTVEVVFSPGFAGLVSGVDAGAGAGGSASICCGTGSGCGVTATV